MITDAPYDTAILALFDIAPDELSRELAQFVLKLQFGAG